MLVGLQVFFRLCPSPHAPTRLSGTGPSLSYYATPLASVPCTTPRFPTCHLLSLALECRSHLLCPAYSYPSFVNQLQCPFLSEASPLAQGRVRHSVLCALMTPSMISIRARVIWPAMVWLPDKTVHLFISGLFSICARAEQSPQPAVLLQPEARGVSGPQRISVPLSSVPLILRLLPFLL